MTAQEEFTIMMQRSGVSLYHDKGFKGKGINILNCESFASTHGKGTGTIIQRIAPESNFFCGDIAVNTKGDDLISATLNGTDLHEYIKENKIDIASVSRSGVSGSCQGWNDYCQKMQDDTGVVIFNSASNDGIGDGETLSSTFPPNVAMLVGAITLNDVRANYSSVGEELDFMAYSGLIGGTSAATPFLAGMMACIMSRYRKLNPTEANDYLKRISKDLGDSGDDTYYGEGMPILLDKTKIELKIGSDKMLVDGIEFKLDQPPKIDPMTGRTLVPVRAIAEGFGAAVTWIDETDTIILEV